MPSRFTASSSLPVMQSSLAGDLGEGPHRLEAEVVGLFEQFRVPLLRYLCGFGLSTPDGEEVIQEVFLALFQHLRDGKPRDNVRGWLFRVAHNLALKRRGRARRDLDIFSETTAEESAVDPSPNPEENFLNSRLKQTVSAVIKALPEQDRMCLSLRAEGLSYREVAEVLNMSLGAVSLSLARSLARIASATKR